MVAPASPWGGLAVHDQAVLTDPLCAASFRRDYGLDQRTSLGRQLTQTLCALNAKAVFVHPSPSGV